MSTAQLRKEIKKSIDEIPADRLGSLADYVEFLTRPSIETRVAQAENDLRAGKGVQWRKVRQDV